MSWITPTADNVLSEFTQRELSLVGNLQGVAANNLEDVLGRVVDEVRENIRSGGKAVDPVATTIPRGILSDAIAIARWRLLVSIPQLKALQSDARKDEYTRAMDKLQRISQGKFIVESPSGEDSTTLEQTGGNIPVATRDTMQGL